MPSHRVPGSIPAFILFATIFGMVMTAGISSSVKAADAPVPSDPCVARTKFTNLKCDEPSDEEERKNYENGNLSEAACHRDGKGTGPFATWHENGEIKSCGTLRNGEFHGLIRFYGQNGRLTRTGHFTSGIADGEMQLFDDEGNVIRSAKFDFGDRVDQLPAIELSASTGVSFADYTESIYRVKTVAVTPKALLTWRPLWWLDASFGGFITGVNLSRSRADIDPRFLGLNARAGTHLYRSRNYRFLFQGGLNYSSLMGSAQQFGYSSLSAQIYPSFYATLTQKLAVSIYGKFVPFVSNRIAFENSERAVGLSLLIGPADASRLSLSFDWSAMDKYYKADELIRLRVVNFGVGYAWN
ncbi:MAG TPA: hypothetical protein VJB59_05360 [Bdellovibrionota bacterium]|nr:hypothetical protein [Bdellovibrionota bacterium]